MIFILKFVVSYNCRAHWSELEFRTIVSPIGDTMEFLQSLLTWCCCFCSEVYTKWWCQEKMNLLELFGMLNLWSVLTNSGKLIFSLYIFGFINDFSPISSYNFPDWSLISVCFNAVRVISLKLKNPEATFLKQIGQNMPRLLSVYHPWISLCAPISFTLSKARSLEEIGKHLEGICNIWDTSSSFCPLMLFFRFRMVWIFVSSLVLIMHIGNFMKPSFDI